MPSVKIYTTNYCGYCAAAKAFLRKKGLTFEEIDVTSDDHARARLVDLSGGQRTVPQIFIGNKHIGGYTDLRRLDADGSLNTLLAA